jgi:ornithine decarboxylase
MDRITEYIVQTKFEKPTLVIDSSIVCKNYEIFKTYLPTAQVYYAVKANPHSSILRNLDKQGSCFDAASISEIRDCIWDGIRPSKISFGNTVKSIQDIKAAYKLGIRTYMADSFQELDKIAVAAPNSNVFIRLLINNESASWPLGKKFGCSEEFVLPLISHAESLGLVPVGISFHIGSQNTDVEAFAKTIFSLRKIYNYVEEFLGIKLTHLNIGGGFPIWYNSLSENLHNYLLKVSLCINKHFKDTIVWCEPGRAISATAGKIACEVVLVSQKRLNDDKWVYLNIGRFHGLAETEKEAIRYRFSVVGKRTNNTPYYLAGPTCDSADILYEVNKVLLPKDITYGDKVIIHDTGVYTSTYTSIGFNGFPPLDVVSI